MGRFFWNKEEHRLRAFWRLALTGLIFLAIFIIESATFGAVFFLVSSVQATQAGGSTAASLSQAISTNYTNLTNSLSGMLLSELGALIAIGCALWISARWIDRRPFADFGFHFDRHWWRSFGFGLGLGALLMAFIFGVELCAGWIQVTHFFYASLASSFGINLLLEAILFIFTGFFEEMMTRGYLLRNLAEGFNFEQKKAGLAVLLSFMLSSAIFGLLHGSNPNATWISTLNLIGAGLFLGLGYVLSGELGLPIGLHIAWNFFEGNVFGFSVSGLSQQTSIISIQQGGSLFWTGGAFGPEAGFIGILAILLGSALIILWTKQREKKVAWCENLAIYHRRPGRKSPVSNP